MLIWQWITPFTKYHIAIYYTYHRQSLTKLPNFKSANIFVMVIWGCMVY